MFLPLQVHHQEEQLYLCDTRHLFTCYCSQATNLPAVSKWIMKEGAMMRTGYAGSCEHGQGTIRFTKTGNIQAKRFNTSESVHKLTASLYDVIK